MNFTLPVKFSPSEVNWNPVHPDHLPKDNGPVWCFVPNMLSKDDCGYSDYGRVVFGKYENGGWVGVKGYMNPLPRMWAPILKPELPVGPFYTREASILATNEAVDKMLGVMSRKDAISYLKSWTAIPDMPSMLRALGVKEEELK